MVASHDHTPVVVSSLVVQSENEMPAFSILDQVETCSYVERGAQVPLPKVDGWRAAEDFEPPLSDFGLVAPIGSTVRDLLLQSREEAGWGLLPVLCILPTGKTADWHWWIDSGIFSPSISLEGCGRRDVYVFSPYLARQSVAAKSPSRKISHGICKTKMGQKPGSGFSRSRDTPTLKSICVEVLGNSLELEQWRVLAYLLICFLSPREKDSIILL